MDSKDSNAALFGSVEAVALKQNGTTETVSIFQLPVRKFRDVQSRLKDEGALIELYCDKPPKWADDLTPESHERLLGHAKEINGDFFSRWLERQKQTDELLPKADMGQLALMLDAMQKQNPKLLEDLMSKAVSSSSVAKPPSSAG